MTCKLTISQSGGEGGKLRAATILRVEVSLNGRRLAAASLMPTFGCLRSVLLNPVDFAQRNVKIPGQDVTWRKRDLVN
jgi:hypothetical protein